MKEISRRKVRPTKGDPFDLEQLQPVFGDSEFNASVMSSELRNLPEAAGSDPICPVWFIAGALPLCRRERPIWTSRLSETPDLAGIAAGMGRNRPAATPEDITPPRVRRRGARP